MESAPPGRLRDTLNALLTPEEMNQPCFRHFIDAICGLPMKVVLPRMTRRGSLGERRAARLAKNAQPKPQSLLLSTMGLKRTRQSTDSEWLSLDPANLLQNQRDDKKLGSPWAKRTPNEPMKRPVLGNEPEEGERQECYSEASEVIT